MPLTSHRVTVRAVIVRDNCVLAIKYYESSCEHPIHYNLPGGGVEEGESIYDGLRRELLEEAGVHIEIGRLLLVSDYVPLAMQNLYGPTPLLTLHFAATLKEGEVPHLPERPDPLQIDVEWLPIERLPVPYVPANLREALETVKSDIFTEYLLDC